MYGAALTENATDASLGRAETLFCSCITGLQAVRDDNGFEESDDGSVFWGYFTPSEYADGLSEMEDLLDLFPSQIAHLRFDTCESLTTEFKATAVVNFVDDEEQNLGVFSSSVVLNTDTLMIVNVVLGIVCGLFLVMNVYYCLMDSKGKAALDTAVPVGIA